MCWLWLIPSGMFLSRYRPDLGAKSWFVWHRTIMIAAILVIAIALALAINHLGELKFSGRHHILGCIVVAGAALQVAGGLVRAGKKSTHRKYWEPFHHLLARLLLCAAVVNIGLGLGYFGVDDDSWWIYIFSCCAVSLGGVLGFARHTTMNTPPLRANSSVHHSTDELQSRPP